MSKPFGNFACIKACALSFIAKARETVLPACVSLTIALMASYPFTAKAADGCWFAVFSHDYPPVLRVLGGVYPDFASAKAAVLQDQRSQYVGTNFCTTSYQVTDVVLGSLCMSCDGPQWGMYSIHMLTNGPWWSWCNYGTVNIHNGPSSHAKWHGIDCSKYVIRLSPAAGEPESASTLFSMEPNRTKDLIARVYDKK